MTTNDKIKSIGKTDNELIELLGISRNTFYKYKKLDKWPKVISLAIDNIHSKNQGND